MSSRHLAALFSLLPRGDIFPRQGSESNLENFFDGIGLSLDGVEDAISEQIKAMFPDQTGNYLEDWERVLNLPPVGITGQTDEQRRDAIVTIFSIPSESPESFFISLALGFGYTITIDADSFDVFTASSAAGDDLIEESQTYIWKVEVHDLSSQDIGIENLINWLKPAHTYAVFEYLGP